MTHAIRSQTSTIVFLGCLALMPAAAQSDPPTALPAIEVTSPRITTPWVTSPIAIGVVDTETHVGDPGLALSETLARVPGVFTQSVYNLNQSLRVSIRGFGSRSAFGVRGIRILVDDIPYTNPDGQTDLDALDLALIDRVEVLRGPASALYGNGAGGVISVTTRQRPELALGRVDAVIGGLGDQRLRAELGFQDERSAGLLALAYRQLEGHRPNMEAESLMGSARWARQIGQGSLGVSLSTLDIEADDPAALSAAEVAADRRQANPGAVNFAVGEQIRQQRAGVVWSSPLGAHSDYQLRGWMGQRSFDNTLPFAAGGQGAFDRKLGGVSAQIDHRYFLNDVAMILSSGLDLEAQTDDRERFNNAPGGVRGEQTLDQRERARGVGVFASATLNWRALATHVGVRHDRIALSVRDRFLSDGDDSGEREFRRSSLNLGAGVRVAPQQLVFTRFGTGFETPTNAELAKPDGGGFNPDLGPSLARNVEVGHKFDHPLFRTEVVLYRIRNKGELIRFEQEGQAGRSFFRNAGVTDRDGVELSASFQLAPPLSATISYAYNDFRFRDDPGGDNQLGGKSIPGLPKQQLFAELAYQPNDAWLARVQAIGLDRVFADDANNVRVPGYVVTNVRLAWTRSAEQHRFTPYVAVNNVFDRDYNDNLRVNAGFERFFEPAPGRVALVGMSASF